MSKPVPGCFAPCCGMSQPSQTGKMSSASSVFDYVPGPPRPVSHQERRDIRFAFPHFQGGSIRIQPAANGLVGVGPIFLERFVLTIVKGLPNPNWRL